MSTLSQPRFRFLGTISLLALVASCQATTAGRSAATHQTAGQPAYDPQKAFMTLDEIAPLPTAPEATGKAEETSQRARRQIDTAQELLAEQRYSEAIQRLERAVRYSPNSLAAHQLMAAACLESGHLARAMEHTVTALQIAPTTADIYLLLARVHLANKDWSKVLRTVRTMQACPDFTPGSETARMGQYCLGQALAAEGYLSAAIAAYNAFLNTSAVEQDSAALRERRIAALIASSHLHERLGQPLEAAADLEQVAADSPGGDWERIAELYRQGGKYDSAAAAALRFIETKPDGTGLALLVEIRTSAKQSDVLLADLQKLAARYPHHAGVIRELAELYVRRQEIDNGIRVLNTFVDEHSDSVEARVTLAELLVRVAQWSDAVAQMVAACQCSTDPQPLVDRWIASVRAAGQVEAALTTLAGRVPTDPHEAYIVGSLAMAAGHIDAAADALARAAAGPAPPKAVLVALGELQLGQLAWRAAADSGRKLIALDGDDDDGYRILGLALTGLDDHKDAEEALQAAIQRNRTDTASMAALAELYALTGRPLKQRQQLQMILEVEHDNARALEGLILLAAGRARGENVTRYVDKLQSLDDPVPYLRIMALLEARRTSELGSYGAALLKILEDHPDSLETCLDLVQYYLVVEDDDNAERYARRVLALEPNHLSALQLLAGVELRRLKFDDALAIYEQLLRIHPRRYAWRRAQVMIMIDDQRFTEVIDRITTLLEDPDLPQEGRAGYQYDLLMCLALEGRLDEARSRLTTWLELTPDDRVSRERYVAVERLSGTPERALPRAEEWFRSASKSQRDDQRRMLVQAYLNAESYADAEAVIRESLASDPDSPAMVGLLIATLEASGNTDGALELAEAALVDESEDLFVRVLEANRIRMLLAAERYDDAIRIVRRQLNSGRGESDDLRSDLGRILLLANRCDEVKRELQTWEDLVMRRARRRDNSASEPSQMDDQDRYALADIQNLLSLCYQRDGQLSQAVQAQEQRWVLMPEDPGSRNDLGYQLAVLGRDIDKAEALVRHAVSTSPREAAFLDSLGWVLYRRGHFEEAGKWLRRAAHAPNPSWRQWLLDDAPQRGADDPVIRDHLGDLSWRLGQSDEAIEHWTAAYELASAQDDAIGLEVRNLVETTPAKIDAAKSGGNPNVAEVLTTLE